MSLISGSFALFVVVTLAVFYLAPRRLQTGVLLAASAVFIVSYSPSFALVYAVLIGFNYGAALRIAAADQPRWWVRAAVMGNLAALVVLKYFDFFTLEIAARLGVTSLGALQVLLPVGMSYAVLQGISYTLDVRNKLMPPVRSLVDLALYFAYFPKLVAGPIERARDFIPQFHSARVIDNAVLGRCLHLILTGLVRKLVIADLLTSLIPNEAFTQSHLYTAPALLFWLAAYGTAIYNDFAGYTSIVRGVSGLFGIELVPNFNAPYFARSFAEFWTRWHMSLSNWLRDYVFSPLTRALIRRKINARHPVGVVLPPVWTMLISGLWHGVASGLVLWGLLHGVLLALERALSLRRPVRAAGSYPLWRQVISVILVYCGVNLVWVAFRTSAPDAVQVWAMLIAGSGWTTFTFPLGYGIVLALMLLSWLLDAAQVIGGEPIFGRTPLIARLVLADIAILLILLSAAALANVPPPFIYQGF